MSWTFRLIEYRDEHETYSLYRIAEVYTDHSGKIRSWTTKDYNLATAHASPRAVRWSLSKALLAFSKPLLREVGDTLEEVPGPVVLLDSETEFLVEELEELITPEICKVLGPVRWPELEPGTMFEFISTPNSVPCVRRPDIDSVPVFGYYGEDSSFSGRRDEPIRVLDGSRNSGG